MAHYLDENGVTYFWSKIKTLFALKTEIPSASSTTPAMDGTASSGTETAWAKGDHVHPTDTSRAPLASPAFTGTPTAPTPLQSDDSTRIATTEFVNDKIEGIDGATYTITQSQQDGHTFTMAGSNGYSQTITIPDNDTTYNPATTSANGLMSSTDKTKLDGFSDASNYALKTDITGIYKYKGSVATESLLPSSGQSAGDVYDIQAASSYGAAGMNVAWTGSAWDALGEMFTITSITNAELDVICV